MEAKIVKFLLDAIGLFIRIVLVPSILLGIHTLAWHIVRLRTQSEDQQISKTYALWLGWGTFVLIVILNLFTDFFVPQQPINAFRSVWLYIIGGFIAGFALIAAVHSFLEVRAISVFVLILSSTSISALYFYVFVDRLREAILISSVSLLVGSLAYAVFFPEVVRSLRAR